MQVVVTGMHRSGTSLFASLLKAAGIDMGQRLVGRDVSNPKGHFEDTDFVELHDAILADNGTTWDLERAPERLRVAETQRSRAADIVAERSGLPLWGWKDPRTCLFLDFWLDLLPEARFVFIFRSAAQVVDSLRRRGDRAFIHQFHGAWPLRKLGFSTFRLTRAIDLWMRYNERIVRFAEAHPDRSYLLDLATLPDGMPAVITHLRDAWGLAVGDIDVSTTLERKLLHTKINGRVGRACRRRSDVVALTARLVRASRAGGGYSL